MFNRVVFENSPYAFPHEGTEESIAKIQRNDLLNFYKTHYLPSNLILAFVGAISEEEAVEIVSEKFGKWGVNTAGGISGLEIEGKNKPKEFSDNHIYIVDKPGAVQSNLKIGHIGIERNNPDFIAVTLMNTVLGGYFGSRINLNLREKHGFTYGARSGFSPRIFPGEFSVETDVRNEVTDASVKLIAEELKRITSEEITDEELQLVKNYLTGLFPLQLETANAVATRVINLKLYNLPKNYYSTYISNLNKLTKADILKAAKKYIHPENLYIIVSGNSDAIKENLSKIKPAVIYDADGNPIN
jgi:zinc protease